MQDEERAAEILRDLLKDKLAVTKWKELLELAGRCYRYSAKNIVFLYNQKPDATLVADFQSWKKVNRYVKRGTHGIYIGVSDLTRNKYVFDISDTEGADINLTWDLSGKKAAYIAYLDQHGYVQDSGEPEDQLLSEFLQKKADEVMKHPEYMKMMERLSGCEEFVKSSITYLLESRCGIQTDSDLSGIHRVPGNALSAIFKCVVDVSRPILRAVNYNIERMEREGIDYGRISERIHRSENRDSLHIGRGRTVLSGHSRTVGTGDAEKFRMVSKFSERFQKVPNCTEKSQIVPKKFRKIINATKNSCVYVTDMVYYK